MTSAPKIIVTNPIHDEVAQRLAQVGEVEMNTSITPWSESELAERVRTATAMMGFMTDKVDAALLRQAPHLKIVSCALKGYDSYDVEACTRAGVWVGFVPDLLTEPTAELALGLAISLARRMREGDAHVRSGTFAGWRAHLYGTGLRGASVAVLGMGKVGSAIVDRLAGFGCARILGMDAERSHPQAVPASLQECMAVADYVFAALPLTPQTLGLVGAGALAASKPGQLLINVGRGSVVDEEAVLRALEAGRLGGYAADVFACEDWGLPERPPAISPALLAHAATVFTPHIGSGVRSVRVAIEHRAADNIIAVLQGRAPEHAVNTVLRS